MHKSLENNDNCVSFECIAFIQIAILRQILVGFYPISGSLPLAPSEEKCVKTFITGVSGNFLPNC